jgi:hypothetical protein
MQSLIKSALGIPKLIGKDTHAETQTHTKDRQESDLIRVTFIF